MSQGLRLELAIAVRGYEMDTRGAVTPGSLARYAEHARWEAVRSGGLGLEAHLFNCVVRAQRLVMHAPAVWPDELLVSTWIGRVGRTSFDFVHRISRPGDGRVIAEDATTAVCIDASGPIAVPDAVRSLVLDDGGPSLEGPPASAPADAWEAALIPRPSDQDVLRHVNQARHVDFVEDARRGAGLGETTRSVWIEHVLEARAGDSLRVLAWALPDGSCAVEVRRADDGRPVTRARLD